MGILLGFAPFIAFAIVEHLLGAFPGLLSGAAVSAALVLRDRLGGRSPKILEIGSVLLFGTLAIYVHLAGSDLPVLAVRLLVDAGLLAIVLVSLAIGTPFTLQYAREHVAPEFWSTPSFRRTNVVITAAWALAFAVITAAEAVLLLCPDIPLRAGILVIVAALVGAFKFTAWYPKRVRESASQ